MNSSSSGSAPKHVEIESVLERSFSRRISNQLATSGGAPTYKNKHTYVYTCQCFIKL